MTQVLVRLPGASENQIWARQASNLVQEIKMIARIGQAKISKANQDYATHETLKIIQTKTKFNEHNFLDNPSATGVFNKEYKLY